VHGPLRSRANAHADSAVRGYLHDDLSEVQRCQHLLDGALHEPALLRRQGGAATGDVVLAALDLDVGTGRLEPERRTAWGPRVQPTRCSSARDVRSTACSAAAPARLPSPAHAQDADAIVLDLSPASHGYRAQRLLLPQAGHDGDVGRLQQALLRLAPPGSGEAVILQ
jgi:hypothetical protein